VTDGEQIERCIDEAKEQIAAKGFNNCDPNAIILVSIDHMTKRFEASMMTSMEAFRDQMDKKTVTLEITGKKGLAFGGAVGAVLCAILSKYTGVQL
jgi:hypothetical protein